MLKSNMFNVGDKVECISADDGLVNGNIYTVRMTDTDNTIKVDVSHLWYAESRFKLVKGEKPVSPLEYSFTLGSEYQVDWNKLREESVSLETPVAHINILNKDYILIHDSVYTKAFLIDDIDIGAKATIPSRLYTLRKLGATFVGETPLVTSPRRLTEVNKIVREIRNAPYTKGSKCTVTVRSIKL